MNLICVQSTHIGCVWCMISRCGHRPLYPISISDHLLCICVEISSFVKSVPLAHPSFLHLYLLHAEYIHNGYLRRLQRRHRRPKGNWYQDDPREGVSFHWSCRHATLQDLPEYVKHRFQITRAYMTCMGNKHSLEMCIAGCIHHTAVPDVVMCNLYVDWHEMIVQLWFGCVVCLLEMGRTVICHWLRAAHFEIVQSQEVPMLSPLSSSSCSILCFMLSCVQPSSTTVIPSPRWVSAELDQVDETFFFVSWCSRALWVWTKIYWLSLIHWCLFLSSFLCRVRCQDQGYRSELLWILLWLCEGHR